MKIYFTGKINPRAMAEYVAGNISEAEAIFSLREAELEEIAELIIEEVDRFFAKALENEEGLGVNGKGEWSPLRIYLRDIRRYPEIDSSETIALARAMESGNSFSEKAREHLICTYLQWAYRVARALAKKYSSVFYFELPDLVQAANLGLVDAVDKWEKSKMRGAKFATYAAHRVTGEILDFLRNSGIVGGRVPRSVQDLAKKLNWILSHWKGESQPSVDTLAKLCGASKTSVMMALAGRPVLESELQSNEEEKRHSSPFEQLFKDESTPEGIVVSYLEAKRCLERIKKALEDFVVRKSSASHQECDREMLLLALGFDDVGMTLEEVGAIFELTESRVCQKIGEFLRYLEERGVEIVSEKASSSRRLVAVKKGIEIMLEIVSTYEESR